MNATLMTPAEYARHRGVQSRSAVSNWKKAGLLIFAECPETGKMKIHVARSDARLNAKLDPMRGRPAAATSAALPLDDAAAPAANRLPSGNASLQDERTLALREQRYGQALKNAQASGELAPVAELERRAAEIGRAARERLQAWFRSVAERLAAEREVRAVMMIGEEGIDGVFAELANDAAEGVFAAVEPEDDADEASADEEIADQADA